MAGDSFRIAKYTLAVGSGALLTVMLIPAPRPTPEWTASAAQRYERLWVAPDDASPDVRIADAVRPVTEGQPDVIRTASARNNALGPIAVPDAPTFGPPPDEPPTPLEQRVPEPIDLPAPPAGDLNDPFSDNPFPATEPEPVPRAMRESTTADPFGDSAPARVLTVATEQPLLRAPSPPDETPDAPPVVAEDAPVAETFADAEPPTTTIPDSPALELAARLDAVESQIHALTNKPDGLEPIADQLTASRTDLTDQRGRLEALEQRSQADRVDVGSRIDRLTARVDELQTALQDLSKSMRTAAAAPWVPATDQAQPARVPSSPAAFRDPNPRAPRFSFEFCKAPISDVFSLLGRLGGRRVEAGDDVTGKLTLSLKHVTVEEALHAIAANRGWTCRNDSERAWSIVAGQAVAFETRVVEQRVPEGRDSVVTPAGNTVYTVCPCPQCQRLRAEANRIRMRKSE